MKKFDDMIYGLQQDIEIPENVWQKYTSTLSNLPDKPDIRTQCKHSKRKLWSTAAAAILLVSTISITAAAHIPWSRGLELRLQTTEKLRNTLVENQMSNFVGQSVTRGNVTVTAQESIVDNYFAYLSFKVDGYSIDDGAEPGFSDIQVVVDNKKDFSGGWNAFFYDGVTKGPNGSLLGSDGAPLEENEKISYKMNDGSMEFQIVLMSTEKGYFLDKPIHVQLSDLGVYSKKAGDVAVDAEGNWEFDWTLTGSSAARCETLDAPLDGSAATVLKTELSPISIAVFYEFPRQEYTEMGIDENGAEFEHTEYVEPPYFTGVRMKDGTMYTGISEGGMSGYVSEDSDVYEHKATLSRVIDVDQVESLLFIKSYPENDEPLTEENLYFVPFK